MQIVLQLISTNIIGQCSIIFITTTMTAKTTTITVTTTTSITANLTITEAAAILVALLSQTIQYVYFLSFDNVAWK